MAADKGSEGSYEPSSSQHSRLLGGTGEVEKLRTALRQKEDQITSLQSQLTNLEATRDRWALPQQQCLHSVLLLLPVREGVKGHRCLQCL